MTPSLTDLRAIMTNAVKMGSTVVVDYPEHIINLLDRLAASEKVVGAALLFFKENVSDDRHIGDPVAFRLFDALQDFDAVAGEGKCSPPNERDTVGVAGPLDASFNVDELRAKKKEP